MRAHLPPLLILLAACAGSASDDPSTDDVDTDSDTPVDTEVDLSADLATRAPFTAPTDPFEGEDDVACGVIDAVRCQGAVQQVCAPYDPGTGTFPDDVDPLQLRAWHYDRWFDLYHSPDGQTSSRDLTPGFGPGTPEATWAARDAFDGWDGYGDSAIWTGVAAHAAMLRWLATGTEPDRLRFEAEVRAILSQFEVTDAVGMLARAHFLIVPDGTPPSADHLTLTASQADDTIRFVARDPSFAPDLPVAYAYGVPDGQGGTATGVVGWQGNPSIDQYTGAMVTLPAAWDLLDDPDLKDRIAAQLTGYLRRLQRVEIRNLLSRPDLAEAAAAALGGGSVDALDLETLDTIVLFALPAYNHTNEDTFPHDAPTDLPTEPTLVLDAGSSTFLADLFGLIARLQAGRRDSWDHVYAPSVRGGDAVHMTHLALMAWHMTGDDRYRAFLVDDLLGTIHTDRVAQTLGALVMPPWCRPYYGDHITLPPLWALLNLLDDGPLRDRLVTAMTADGDGKLNADLGNAKFDLMIADDLPPGDTRRAALEAEAMTLLTELGGNGGVLDEPRRTYTITEETLEATLGSPLPVRCPTTAERAMCEDGFTALGITIPGTSITHTCVGSDLECVMDDGACAFAIATEPLPVGLRRWQDFLWQRSPVELGAVYAPEGRRSSPGLDLTESYWLARVRGVAPDTGLVLAWEDAGFCE
ncbi:MAG: hypothetical protein H6733_06225 [Alphaproteobacteria bacterium]|nr:hypothetical protein [Alphaproteobacteria bacterium]